MLVSNGQLLSADWLVNILINLLPSAHGMQKMALGERGAVSPNPKAAPQDLRCFSSVGP